MKNTSEVKACSCLILAAMLLSPKTSAQQADEQKGVDQGNYNIRQDVEFGGRFTSVAGDLETYNTMVNLQEGRCSLHLRRCHQPWH